MLSQRWHCIAQVVLVALFISPASAFVSSCEARHHQYPNTGNRPLKIATAAPTARKSTSSSSNIKTEPTVPGEAVPTRQLKNPNEVRGNRYGYSTILTPEDAAAAVGVEPANAKATKTTWQRAWRLHKKALPLLHAFDRNKPPDSSLSLAVLWWKALSGNDASSPAADGGLSYDLLPRGSRKIVSRLMRRLYPRLHHANVEIRTVYLDRAVSRIVKDVHQTDTSKNKRIRLIVLGGGYDIRSIKLRERGLIDEAIELDLPQVIEAKRKLLTNRLLKRRRAMKETDLPTLFPIDLNDIDGVRKQLVDIVTRGDEADWDQWHNIFLFEGVMIYLNDGVPSALLRTCSGVLIHNGLSGSLVFADRLEHVPEGEEQAAEIELSSNGWSLNEWLPKPGLARHMGRSSLIDSS